MSGAFPVVDIAAFTREGASVAERAAVVERIGQACETIGFFAVTGHGVTRRVIDDLIAAAYAFFDLPLDEKLAVKRPRPEQNRGSHGHGRGQGVSLGVHGRFSGRCCESKV
jgi:isopenicillin N synthase-like dioxygenase